MYRYHAVNETEKKNTTIYEIIEGVSNDVDDEDESKSKRDEEKCAIKNEEQVF